MVVTERGKAARMRSTTARGRERGNVFPFFPFDSFTASISPSFFCSLLVLYPPARHRADPSNVPDIGLGALDVEDAEGLGDDGSHS